MLAVLLGVSYPIAAHVAVVTGRPQWTVASIGLLLALMLLGALARGRLWAWALLLGGVAALWRLSGSTLATLPLFAPPILITAGVAWLFGRSLRAGEVPLIERFARAVESAPLGEPQRVYARQLTAAWAGLTGAMTLSNFVLALLAEPRGLLVTAGLQPPFTVPLEVWSLFANVLNYVLLGAMFAGEFAYRRYRFPQQSRGGFVDFVRQLVRLGPQVWRGDDAR